MFVFLWTDVLVYLLIAATVGLGVFISRREYLCAPWRRVGRSRIAMASAVVLSAYLVIGILDSLHFHPRIPANPVDTSALPQGAEPLKAQFTGSRPRYSTDVISVFDWIAAPLRMRVEKTYSAPFAVRLYAKETIEGKDNRLHRLYPRLGYGGRHLKNPERERGADILFRSLRAALFAGAGGLAFACLLVGLLAWRDRSTLHTALMSILRRKRRVPWHVILITLAILLIAGNILAELSTKYHVLGTDKVGQDVFYQALKSVRTGLLLGILTTVVVLPLAVVLGIAAGYFGGWIDDVIQYTYTTLSSIPAILLIAASVLMLQVFMANHAGQFESLAVRSDLRLLFLCVILGVTSWTGLCRLLRAETLKLREMEYVQAARALGVGRRRTMLRHILPNVMHIILISVVLDFSRLVLAEAVLAYVNIGVDPATISWGNMINGARLELAREPVVWWSLFAAFLFMFVLVLSANLFADAIRDAFDPRIRGR